MTRKKKLCPVLIVGIICLAVALRLSAQVGSAPAASQYPIVPRPQRLVAQPGEFVLPAGARLYVDGRAADAPLAAGFFKECFGPATGYVFQTAASEDAADVALVYDASVPGPDGAYLLDIWPGRIVIRAASGRGYFYGLETVRQLFPPAIESRGRIEGMMWTAPCIHVEDAPRFQYRGMHLDCGRHFFSPAFVKKFIDLMALQKMDYFHWHLTEDQGWRIEIKRYPKLTSVGSVRARTVVGHGAREPFIYDDRPYGGYYTQKEIREIVEYARRRFVTIIPEIEMPGHSLAALAAYPELGCTGGPYKVADVWGVFPDVFCPGKESTFTFVENVLDEVCRLFPGPFVHIGGDECPKDSWKACPLCQARIKAEGLKDEAELQSYFIRRVEKMLQKRGKRLIGWDEILEGGLAPQATVMSWRGTQGGIDAAKEKHDVIMTPTSTCYFDYYQADPAGQPLTIGGFLTMKKVYGYEPLPADLSEAEKAHILGTQGNIWTEYQVNEKYVEYMAFPRACALAEVAWTQPAGKDWADFLSRMEGFYKRLEALDVNYFRGNRGALIE